MQSNIDGNNYYYGGGGGGGSQTSGQISGNGGLGGGGGGANYSSGTAGTGGGSARNSGGNGQQTNSYPPCDGGAGGANTGGGGGGMGISVSNGGAGGSGIVIVRYITTGTASDALVVNSSGNVGIGTTNPSFQLQLSANSAAKPGGGSWADSSDSRLKKDVTPVTDATSKIMSLNPVQYKWINPTEHGNQTGVQGGFIAQELKQIFPNWVNEIDPQGKDKELIQGGKAMAIQLPFEFDALLVQGLKEINIKVEALTTEVESEKLKVERLAVDVESEKLKVIGLDTRLASVETTTEANSTSIEELERRLAEIEQMEVGAGLVPAQDETEGSEPLEPSASEPLPPSEDSPSSEGEKIDGLIALSLSDQLQGEVIANLNVKNLTVVENVIVAGDLKVEGHIVAGEDTAGELIIEPGVYETQKDPITGLDILDDFGQPMLKLDEFGQKIPVLYKKIEFKKPYTGTPVIGLTPIGEVGLNPEFRYAITEKSQFGFTVKINRAFTTDVKFDWQVMERGEIRN